MLQREVGRGQAHKHNVQHTETPALCYRKCKYIHTVKSARARARTHTHTHTHARTHTCVLLGHPLKTMGLRRARTATHTKTACTPVSHWPTPW